MADYFDEDDGSHIDGSQPVHGLYVVHAAFRGRPGAKRAVFLRAGAFTRASALYERARVDPRFASVRLERWEHARPQVLARTAETDPEDCA
jgi:hypothetical protein